jgi:organic radical activating enzyme
MYRVRIGKLTLITNALNVVKKVINKRIFRYRIITNLQCNQRCSFCYQNNKPAIGTDNVLSLNKLEQTMKKVGKLERATLMGGESTLLANLTEYIKLAKEYAETVCLVTNGTLLTKDKLFDYKEAGLDEIAISISSMENYIDLGTPIFYAHNIIDNCRVNIPRCEESSYDKLHILVRKILSDGYGCVVCEDLNGRYGEPHDKVIMGWEDVYEAINDGHNFIKYRMEHLEEPFSSRWFGLFAHYSGYDNTDVIISPLGNFSIWEQYCKAVGNNDVH